MNSSEPQGLMIILAGPSLLPPQGEMASILGYYFTPVCVLGWGGRGVLRARKRRWLVAVGRRAGMKVKPDLYPAQPTNPTCVSPPCLQRPTCSLPISPCLYVVSCSSRSILPSLPHYILPIFLNLPVSPVPQSM